MLKTTYFKNVITIVLSCFFFSTAFAQTPDWNTHGNAVDSSSTLGSNNYKDLKIVTDSVTRMTITKDGDVYINKNLILPNSHLFVDTIKSGGETGELVIKNDDSTIIRITSDKNVEINSNVQMPNGSLQTDSLRVRVIHVGDSSLIIGTNSIIPIGGGPVQGLNLIRTNTNQPIVFGRNTATFANFPGVGIGTMFPITTLHLNVNGANPCYTQYTNNNTGSTVPAFNGFRVGIEADQTALIWQFFNMPLNFLTSNNPRMSILANGNVGVGDYTGFTAQNLLHLYEAGNTNLWQQFTNDNTGSGANDGFHLGLFYDGSRTATDAEFRQYETSDIRFFTDYTNTTTSRMIIMGHNNIPGTGASNNGYVGVGTVRIPRSLLHIGPSYGGIGWRDWMVYGAFVTAGVLGTDNMYVGLKTNEDDVPPLMPGADRQDAVITWGDNPGDALDPTHQFGPDMFRILYAGGVAGLGANADGQEVSRYMPNGNVGIGNFSSNSGARTPLIPSSTLDINGELSVRTVAQDNTLTQVLVIDPANYNANDPGAINKVMYRDANTLGNINSCGAGSTNNYITKWTNTSASSPILCTSIVYDNGTNVGIGVGTTPNTLTRLDVSMTGSNSRGGSFIGERFGIFTRGFSATEDNVSGLFGQGQSTSATAINIFGISGTSLGGSASATCTNVGVVGSSGAVNNGSNYGFRGVGANSLRENYGADCRGGGGQTAFGGLFIALEGTNGNFGIWAGATGTNSVAGFFVGDVTTTGVYNGSDSTLKSGIENLNNPLVIINQLFPKTYVFDTATYNFMNLPADTQIGLIAQDVQPVLPALVKHIFFPAEYDTTGTMVHDSLSYLGLNYTGIIPILVGAIKQLDSISTSRLQNGRNALTQTTDTLASLIGGPDVITHYVEWGGTPLRHNTVIPMIDDSLNEHNIYFTGQSALQNERANIGIGYPTDSTLQAKLDVVNVNTTTDSIINPFAGRFINKGIYTDISGGFFTGIYARSCVAGYNVNFGGAFYADSGYHHCIGVYGEASSNTPFVNYGVNGFAANCDLGIGVGGAGNGTGTSLGISGYASNATWMNYGVYGLVSPIPGAANFAGFFDGDVYTTGSYLPSDSKLKKEITPLSGDTASNIIKALHPKTYVYDRQQFSNMPLPEGNQYGLLADDVEKILPNLVKLSRTVPKRDSVGNITSPSIEFKALNYTGLVPILVAGFKEQQTKIDTLQAQLQRTNAALQELLNCCKGSSRIGRTEESTDTASVVLGNSAIILDQNSPNPFAEKTTITYFIPADIRSAQIIFYETNGNVLKMVEVTTRGAGSLLVYASNLSSGIYTYALIADGKLIDSKKMVCQK